MRKLKIFFWCIALITICLNGFTQYKKNAVVLELLGKSVIPFDISYERFFSERFHVGGGIGMPTKTKFQGARYDGEDKQNYYNFDVPIYCGYAFGQKKHHLISELGIAFGVSTENRHANFLGSLPFISLGYEFRGEKYIFRVPIYLALRERYKEPRQIVPWIGLSIGKLF